MDDGFRVGWDGAGAGVVVGGGGGEGGYQVGPDTFQTDSPAPRFVKQANPE